MDRELKNFKQKLAAIKSYHALLWPVVFVVKTVIDKIKRKLFKKKNRYVVMTNRVPGQAPLHLLDYIEARHTIAGAKITIPVTTGKIDWATPGSDIQNLHLLHRFQSAPLRLLQAGTPEEFHNIVCLIAEQMQDWINHNPPGSPVAWHPYTVSERLINWIWVLHFAKKDDLFDQNLILPIHESIVQQASYLDNNIETHLGHHNHLINNARALLTVGVAFPTAANAGQYLRKGVLLLQKEWPLQILPDGVHVEQSLSYHFLLTRSLWEFKMLFRQSGIEFPFEEDLTKMIVYASAMTRPDGTIPLLGHITPDWNWKELVGLLPVWGAPGVPSLLASVYRKENPRPIEWVDEGVDVMIFPHAGQGIIRNRELHAVLSCDPRPSIEIHGDQNRLGIDVWWQGTHLVRDTGLSSYNLDDTRAWFESAAGQSTYTIDGLEPVVSNWRQRQLPHSYCQSAGSVSRGVDGHALVASHSGYHRLPNPVTVSRSISVQDETLVVIDTATGTGEHHYKAAFHFGHVAAIPATENSITLFDAVTGRRFLLSWKYVLLDGIVKGDFAEGYGRCSKGDVAEFSTAFVGDLKVEYTIVPC